MTNCFVCLFSAGVVELPSAKEAVRMLREPRYRDQYKGIQLNWLYCVVKGAAQGILAEYVVFV
eukprot:472650-Pelagomonas_calceolata.AAC.1